jgi:hypothetical protein
MILLAIQKVVSETKIASNPYPMVARKKQRILQASLLKQTAAVSQ